MNKITADGVAATEGTEAGEFEMPQIWHRPLMISDFEGVPAGYTVTLHYNSSNEGSMDWTHRAIVDGERGKRLLGSADGAPEMPCLYEFAQFGKPRGEPYVCRGSGAEPCWNISGPPKLAADADEEEAKGMHFVRYLGDETEQSRAAADAFPHDALSHIRDRPLTLEDFAIIPQGAVVLVYFRGRTNGSVWWRHSGMSAMGPVGRFGYSPTKPASAMKRLHCTGPHPFEYDFVGIWSKETSRLFANLPGGLRFGGDRLTVCWGIPDANSPPSKE